MSTSVRTRRKSAPRYGGRASRTTSRSGTRGRSQRSRRALVIGGVLLVGALGVFLLVTSDRFQRLLDEEETIKGLPPKQRARIRDEEKLMTLLHEAHDHYDEHGREDRTQTTPTTMLEG